MSFGKCEHIQGGCRRADKKGAEALLQRMRFMHVPENVTGTAVCQSLHIRCAAVCCYGDLLPYAILAICKPSHAVPTLCCPAATADARVLHGAHETAYML
eukprot:1158705-Pelagomonas_calceolata.AAC.7